MNYLWASIELVILNIFGFSQFKLKINKKNIIYTIFVLILTSTVFGFCFRYSIEIPIRETKWNIFFPLLIAGECLLLLPVMQKKLACGITASLAFLMDILAKTEMAVCFHLSFDSLNSPTYSGFLFYCVYFSFYFITYCIYEAFVHFEYNEMKKPSFIIIPLLMIVGAITFILINFVLSILSEDKNTYLYTISFNLILAILFSIVSIATHILLKKIQKNREELEKYKIEYIGKNFFDLVMEKQKELIDMRHNIANHIETMQTFNIPELTELKDDWIKKYNSTKMNFIGDDLILDAILTFKNKTILEKNIPFIFNTNVRSVNINVSDKVSLFSNLLDNAIENTEQTKEPLIDLEITMTNQNLKILISNSYDPNIIIVKENPQFHHRGLSIIKDIVKKYNGKMDINKTENTFTVSILLNVN